MSAKKFRIGDRAAISSIAALVASALAALLVLSDAQAQSKAKRKTASSPALSGQALQRTPNSAVVALPAETPDPPQFPALPVEFFAKWTPGLWAEYSLSDDKSGATLRWSLVANEASSVTLEMRTLLPSAAMARPPSRAAATYSIDEKGNIGALQKVIVTSEKGPNILMPEQWSREALRFTAPSKDDFVGLDKVARPGGGVIEASRYRQQTKDGIIDVWLSKDVPPLGVAQFSFTPNALQSVASAPQRPIVARVIAMGDDAAPTVTGPVIPFGTRPQAEAGQGQGVLNKGQPQ